MKPLLLLAVVAVAHSGASPHPPHPLVRSEARWAPAHLEAALASPTLSSESEALLVRELGSLERDQDRVDALMRATVSQRLTSAQVARLVEPLVFDRSREQALVALHPRVVDPDRWELALGTLTFPSARRRVIAALTTPAL